MGQLDGQAEVQQTPALIVTPKTVEAINGERDNNIVLRAQQGSRDAAKQLFDNHQFPKVEFHDQGTAVQIDGSYKVQQIRPEAPAAPQGFPELKRDADGVTTVGFPTGEKVVVGKDGNVTVYNKDGKPSQDDGGRAINHTDPPYYEWTLPNGAKVVQHGGQTEVSFTNGSSVTVDTDGKLKDFQCVPMEPKAGDLTAAKNSDRAVAETPHEPFRGEPIHGEPANGRGSNVLVGLDGKPCIPPDTTKTGPADLGKSPNIEIGKDPQNGSFWNLPGCSESNPDGNAQAGPTDVRQGPSNRHPGDGNSDCPDHSKKPSEEEAHKKELADTVKKYFDDIDQPGWILGKNGYLTKDEITTFLTTDKGQQLSEHEKSLLLEAAAKVDTIQNAHRDEAGFTYADHKGISRADLDAYPKYEPFIFPKVAISPWEDPLASPHWPPHQPLPDPMEPWRPKEPFDPFVPRDPGDPWIESGGPIFVNPPYFKPLTPEEEATFKKMFEKGITGKDLIL